MFYSLDYGPFNTSLVPDLSGNTVVVDSPFNLTCSAVASPLPRYRFSRDGISLNTSAVELYTTSVSEKRSPVSYSCTPFNDYGEGRTEKITLTVYCKCTYL